MSDSPSPTPQPRTGGSWRWEPPTPEALQKMLPQYEVHMLVGRGGMGAVYKGIQLSLDRAVAIKVLPPAMEQQDQAFAERFRNEARLMGRMSHPAIVGVYDFGSTADGQLYFVMEYVDGTDVQHMIAREGRLPPPHALAITAHLCDALGYAHKQGIVHRDIKPSNVLIDVEGRVKVADFGLAKLTSQSQHSNLTQTGVAMGTPDYVAPEAFTQGSDVDSRADIYAVGVMLYQMLTGDIPRGMFRMPSQKFASIDPRFDDIVRHAMEHYPEERYQSSQELRLALDVILTTPRAEAGQQSSAVLPKQPPQRPGRTVVPSSRSPGSTSQHQSSSAPQPQPYQPPPAPAPASSTMPYIIGALLILGFGGWFILNQQKTQTPHQPQTVPVVTTPPVTPDQKATAKPQPASPVKDKPLPAPSPTKPTPPSTSKVASAPVAPMTPPTAPGQPPTSPPAPPPTPPESIPERLSKLESKFQSAFERDVNGPYNEQITTLSSNYLAALDRAMEEASNAARLDEALALREEKQRFTTHKFMPSIDPANLHRTLIGLRNSYRGAEKKFIQQRDASALPLYDRYIGVLTTLERECFAQGRSTDAAAVRTKREDVTSRRKQRATRNS